MKGDIAGGRISAVEPQKKDPARVSVFLDGEFAFGLDGGIAIEHGLHAGAVVAGDAIRSALRADAVLRGFRAALGMLSYGPRTVQEIRKRLSMKDFAPEVVDAVVNRLVDAHYLDDRALARDYAAARVRVRGEGVHRIRLGLKRRGIEADIVQEVMDDLVPDVDWLGLAREQARVRWQRLSATADPVRRRKKLFDYLVRKGFDYDVARSVTRMFEDQPVD